MRPMAVQQRRPLPLGAQFSVQCLFEHARGLRLVWRSAQQLWQGQQHSRLFGVRRLVQHLAQGVGMSSMRLRAIRICST
jgi:hypothetical protein